MKIQPVLQSLLALVLMINVNGSYAQISIDISGGTVRGKPIAIVPFKTLDSSNIAAQMDQIIANDLKASGKFEPIDPQTYMSFPSKGEEVRFKDWRFVDAEVLVIGELWPTDVDVYELRFRIYDVARELEIGQGQRIPSLRGSDLRRASHIVSDAVYTAFTNQPGAFDSRMAFVQRSKVDAQKYRHRLMVADWDGFGAQEVFASWRPLLSPSWSPDGKQLAFVSFTKNGSVVRVLELATGQHNVIAQFAGVNAAPSWSPDGRQLAYSTSRNGSPDIYIYDFATRAHHRVSTHYGIDTEPAWSPDGRTLLFTSNRSGRPQIYQYDLAREETSRITFEGDENANATYDHNGKRMSIVYDGGQIAVRDAVSGQLTWITRAKFDESPSFSPNGDMVLYATEQGYEPAFFVASSDGRVKTRIKFIQGDVREPAWSPLR